MPGQLELRTEPSGPRHYLNGKPVRAGQGLFLLLAPDVWVPGRYEWTFRRKDRPRLYLELGGHAGQEVELRLPEEALLRWPGE
ncbi:MAG TPA: hypothetical protein VFU23_11590 [Gemmatimonadales bacterium]|nr:hypothetical protein [Gemmatimonadales bacterium]